MRALRRVEASACPVWVRGRESRVVARWGCPRERGMRRGVTPAASRGGQTHAGGYGWRHPLWRYRLAVWRCGRRPGHWSAEEGKPPEALGCERARWRARARWGAAGLSRRCGAACGSLRARGRTGLWRPCHDGPGPGGAAHRWQRPAGRAPHGAGGPSDRRWERRRGCARGGRLQEPLDLLHPEDGGETVGGVRTQECKDVPVALEDVRREKADATGAETHGRGGEAVDMFPVQEVVLECLFREAVGEVWEHCANRRTSRTEDACVRAPLPLSGRAASMC
jgi:hypothetical protein